MSSRAKCFSQLLQTAELTFAMEAHNGLSAKIVEEAGFPLIWASGLSISAALGLRDRNEASWTQVLEVLEFMADGTSIPILVDGDTGHGDFNNFRRLVVKLCQRNLAAVCIEDKHFPKTNSFVDGDQSLADVSEVCGKIKAGKDSQQDPDFCIVARTEALIAGRSRAEALDRAAAYVEAGADGILVHSPSRPLNRSSVSWLNGKVWPRFSSSRQPMAPPPPSRFIVRPVSLWSSGRTTYFAHPSRRCGRWRVRSSPKSR